MYLISCNQISYLSITDNIVVVFQDCSNLMEHVPGAYSETYYDVSQFLHVIIEEDPFALPFPVTKAEHEVSFMPVCPPSGTFHTYLDLCVSFLLHTRHPHESAQLCVDFEENF
jgi:hypothetical protein